MQLQQKWQHLRLLSFMFSPASTHSAYTEPPMPSTGPFPCEVAKKFHVICSWCLASRTGIAAAMNLFLNCDGGPSDHMETVLYMTENDFLPYICCFGGYSRYIVVTHVTWLLTLQFSGLYHFNIIRYTSYLLLFLHWV